MAGRLAGVPHIQHVRDRVAIVCDGSMPTERTVLTTLEQAADAVVRHAVRPPAVVVVGDVGAVANPTTYDGSEGRAR